MQETTGADYQSSAYAKAMFLAESKAGKTFFLVASALGLLPWQKYGGIVDRPEHLHIISLDANALGGMKRGLVETLGAKPEALKYNVFNLQEDCRNVATYTDEYDYTLYNTIITCLHKIRERATKGTHCVIISSLTTLAVSLERAVGGPPGEKAGGGMDQSKWQDFARQIAEIRNIAQPDNWHCLWEAHIYKPPKTGQGKGDVDDRKETIQVSGKSGTNFPNNVEQLFRLRRLFGEVHPGTKVDRTYLDTRPALDFIIGGRLFTEALDAKEWDLTLTFAKLGLTVGRWGAPKKAKK